MAYVRGKGQKLSSERKRQLVDVLAAGGPMRPKDIAAAMGLSSSYVSELLTMLLMEHQVASGSGGYRLTETGRRRVSG